MVMLSLVHRSITGQEAIISFECVYVSLCEVFARFNAILHGQLYLFLTTPELYKTPKEVMVDSEVKAN